MKKTIKYAMLSLSLCVVVGAICAYIKCESSTIEKNSLTEAVSKDSKWLREVNYSLNLTTRVSSDEQVVLKDYKYLGVVDSKEAKQELIDDIFYSDAATIRYGRDLGAIEFYTWNELERYYNYGEFNKEFIAKISDKIAVGRTEALELTWLYKGVTYKSKAIVDRVEGIVFDNIASYALDYFSKKPRQVNHSRGRLLSIPTFGVLDKLDSLSSIVTDSTYKYVYEYSAMADEVVLTTGKTAWWYNIQAISIFNKDNILVSGRCYSNSGSEIGWNCQALAKTISGEENVSPFHEFAWAWAFGNTNTTINISFAGNGFSITGGDHKQSGTEIHSPRYY